MLNMVDNRGLRMVNRRWTADYRREAAGATRVGSAGIMSILAGRDPGEARAFGGTGRCVHGERA